LEGFKKNLAVRIGTVRYGTERINLLSTLLYLAGSFLLNTTTDVQELLKKGDVGRVGSVVQQLRRICNSGSLAAGTPPTSPPSSSRGRVVPAWARLHPRPARQLEKLLEPRPLHTVSLENINLVFLKQELTTTGIAGTLLYP
jgi:hypothetical protein